MKKRHALFLLLALLCLQAAHAERSFLVDADWLAAHIDDNGLVILEVRYHPHRYHTLGHIPGAVGVQRIKDLGDNMANPLMRFPSREAFQKILRAWGVNNDSTVVIYDDSSSVLASRVFFLLKLYGFDMNRVKVLDGGSIEWTAFEEMSKQPAHPKLGNVTLKPADKRMYIEWTAVYEDVVSRRDPRIVLLDARPNDMYTGKVIEHASRGGHIPGAINIPSLDGTDGQKWISESALAAMYASIPKEKTLYVYCDDGFRMSLAYLQLTSLGYRDVRLYNGGWSHWGNRPPLPAVQGDKPYSGDFDL